MCRFRILSLIAFALASCGGSSGGNPAMNAAQYTVTFQVATEPGAIATPAKSPIVLYDQQFLDFTHNALVVVVAISPSPNASPSMTWSSSTASVVVQPNEPNYPSPAPMAPPNGTIAAIGASYGASTIRVDVGAPVNASMSIAAIHYPSLSFGCHFRYDPAFDFDPGAKAMQTASDDLYATIGSDKLDPLNPCTALTTAPGTPEVWHTPYGGVLLPDVSTDAFPAVSASQWSNAGTQFAPQSGVLLFKTKGGLIVKARVPIGPYQVSTSDGRFPY